MKKKEEALDINGIIKDIKSNTDKNLYGPLFIKLINGLRPDKYQNAVEKMTLIVNRSKDDKAFESAMENLFIYLFNTQDSQSLFTSVGVLTGETFFTEFSKKMNAKFLPPLPDKRSMNYLLEQAFNKYDDYKWVDSIPNNLWIDFFMLAVKALNKENAPVRKYLINALNILSYRVSSLGLDDDLSSQLRNQNEFISPFIELNKQIQSFLFVAGNESSSDEIIIASGDKVRMLVAKCETIIEDIKRSTLTFGTSLRQTYLLQRNEEQLQRIRILLRFLTPGEIPEKAMDNSVNLFKSIIKSICKRNSLSDLFRNTTTLLAYQIAEHKSESGEHYITTTRSEYTSFFYSAAGGGVIIAFAAMLKALIHSVHMLPFWQSFLFGLNYAIAFVLIFITGASLATKQPAMTASALASSLDARKGSVSLEGLSIMFAKVWRSQFASFIGNLIIVFPLAYILSFSWDKITGHSLLATKKECLQALRDQNPLTSLAWLYACITGVALFISGIISGYFDNKTIYSNFSARMKEHTGLKKIFQREKLNHLSDYLQANLGGIIGNVVLGFMLGYATLIGQFFGIPFDIRHITISTAYFAFGLEGLKMYVSHWDIIWTFVGVIGIGFFNFLLSFSLAFYVAIRSRNVRVTQLPKVAVLITRYFFKHPLDFVFPPKNDRKPSEVFSKKNLHMT
nr:formate/nitrite transporter family protein [Arachidicoccus sp.]